MFIQPYLHFDGRCEEALEFYREALDAKVEMMIGFKENPTPSTTPPGSEEKIMHCSFKIGNSSLMASDGMCGGAAKFAGVTLTIGCDSTAEAERLFAALRAGGEVRMPLNKTFFAERFGMVADRFGVSWMILTK